ncbi:hypothetical protein ACVRYF_09485 [Streptococcus intermedius]
MKNTELKSLTEQMVKNEIRFSEKVVEIATGFLEKTFTAEEAMKRITREATTYSLERFMYMGDYERRSQKED